MAKTLSTKKLSDTLVISECTDGFWLYDYTRGMNLSMRSKSVEAAFVEALTYYQKRLSILESDYASINDKIDSFINSVSKRDDDKGFAR